jgi:sugar lactone lactonase YvrE
MENRGGPVGANTLAWGSFLTFDAAGNLWVADTLNNRVLEYVPPFSNGMDATLALGQPSLTSGALSLSASSATSMSHPSGVAFDASGNLWVADYWNNRVLKFVPPFSTGMGANAVLGQPDFTTSAAGATRSGLNGPIDVAFARDGSLLVTDLFNNRTLLFAPPFTSGMNANLVFGQPDFSTTSTSSTPTAANQGLPGFVLVF